MRMMWRLIVNWWMWFMVDWRRRRRIGLMLRSRIWMMCLIGLMRNGFGIPKFWSVGAFWMVEHLRLMIFWNIRIIFSWRLIMAIFGRRWSMMPNRVSSSAGASVSSP